MKARTTLATNRYHFNVEVFSPPLPSCARQFLTVADSLTQNCRTPTAPFRNFVVYYIFCSFDSVTRGPFLERPETFRTRKASSKTMKPFMYRAFYFNRFCIKQSLHLCSLSNLRIFLVFQLRTFEVGFSGPKTFRDFRGTGPRCHTVR